MQQMTHNLSPLYIQLPSLRSGLLTLVNVSYLPSVLSTFRTVFWSIYGRSEAEAVTLGGYNNTVTENIGEVIDGMYNIVMVILLLNILIAMMSRSFDKIQVRYLVIWSGFSKWHFVCWIVIIPVKTQVPKGFLCASHGLCWTFLKEFYKLEDCIFKSLLASCQKKHVLGLMTRLQVCPCNCLFHKFNCFKNKCFIKYATLSSNNLSSMLFDTKK